jgi:hypothetical protein
MSMTWSSLDRNKSCSPLSVVTRGFIRKSLLLATEVNHKTPKNGIPRQTISQENSTASAIFLQALTPQNPDSESQFNDLRIVHGGRTKPPEIRHSGACWNDELAVNSMHP